MGIVQRLIGLALGAGLVMLGAASQSQAANAASAPNAYKLDISIEKAGAQVANPKFTVVFGSPAVVTVTNPQQKDGAYRIQATATPSAKTVSGKGTVRIDMVVLEQISGAWVILGEPSVVAYEGTLSSVEVAGAVGGFKVNAKATPEFNQKAVNFKGETCPALTAPMAKNSTGPIVSIRHGGTGCCSVGCSDGSGHTMNCCGAIECCACGVCCRPPEV